MAMKHLITLGSALALAFSATPIAAQEASAESAAQQEALSAILGAFEVEPLTPEQEARLPLARQIVEQFIPEGAMQEAIDSMFGGMLEPLAEMGLSPQDALNDALGYSVDAYQMDDDDVDAALAIADPVWRERNEAESEAVQQMMSRMAEVMEPVMRDVMTELYAIYFTESQLTDIQGFFSTDSGAAFARESWRMSTDPRIMASFMGNDEFWEAAIDFDAFEAELAALPAPRSYSDHTDDERVRLSALTGISEESLQQGMGWEATTEFEVVPNSSKTSR